MRGHKSYSRTTSHNLKHLRKIFFIIIFCSGITATKRNSETLFLSSDSYGLRDFLTNDCLTVLSGSSAEHQTRLGGEKRGALCKGKKTYCFPLALLCRTLCLWGTKQTPCKPIEACLRVVNGGCVR